MSWLFGYFGNTDQTQFDSPETHLCAFKDKNFVLFAGGNKQTCFFKSESFNSCWTVNGVGLLSAGNGYKILDADDWSALMSANPVNLKPVNGHFVAISYSGDELRIFTDELGLREIYFVKLDKGFGFTTRIDWLKFFIKPEIELKEFGSRWLLQNQISLNGIIKNAFRLVCANATIKENSLSIEKNEWQPNFEMPGNKEIFNSVLHQLLSIKDRKILLSLSGGIDSRLLLSYLTTKNFDRWDTHTFGDPDHPDSKIASQLLKSLDRENEVINDELPSRDHLVRLVNDYSVLTAVTNPVSSILNLRFYDRLTDQDKIIIDGGFGEIWRRAFANRLLLVGRKHLNQKNASKIFSYLKYFKADIFTDDALVEMQKGAINQLEDLFDILHDPLQIGSAEWIDLFSIRCRLTNYYSPEQARVDQFATSFMPLVQKDILNLLFGITDTEKKNGKLFKQLLWKNSRELTKLPLVKGNITHPFNASSISARLHSKIKNKLGLSYQSKRLIEFQNSLKEFIGDILQSTEVRNYEYYDHKKLERLANDFSANSYNYNSEVDWFLSFELFREGITKQ